MSTPPVRVAILGSGPAALSTAFQLTEPEVAGKFDVTIYQMGWRSGGLCAGGRVLPELWVNQNGTHYLFGCYEEALYLLRRCCDELIAHGDLRFGSFADQLIARSTVVMKHHYKGDWHNWTIHFPEFNQPVGKTGAPFGPVNIFKIAIKRIIDWITIGEFTDSILAANPNLGFLAQTALRADLAKIHFTGQGLLKLLDNVEADTPGIIDDLVRDGFLVLLLGLRKALSLFMRPLSDLNIRMCQDWILIDLALTCAIGALRDDAVNEHLVAKLDNIDFKAWLRHHGAEPHTVDSPPVDLWYDAMASFEKGDFARPLCAAGAALSCLGQILFNYQGAISWQMRHEVADTLVGPIVANLKRRGVKFVYFHRVWELHTNGHQVHKVTLERQVELNSGDPASYDPFFYPLPAVGSAGPRPLWPDTPNMDQIKTIYAADHALDRFYCPRAGVEVSLEQGRDYDVLVSALSGPTLKWYAAQLGPYFPRWHDLFANLRSVETQGLRLWFKGTLPEMGWDLGPPILSSFVLPFATWEDPSPVLATQIWPTPAPQTVSHLFGPLPFDPNWPDPQDVLAGQTYLDAQQAKTQATGDHWLATQVGALWPCVTLSGTEALDTNTCARPAAISAANGPGQLRANSGPDQGYLWLYPGSWRYRVAASKSGIKDFYTAGDWMATSFPCGSVEGAAIAGRDTALAIRHHY